MRNSTTTKIQKKQKKHPVLNKYFDKMERQCEEMKKLIKEIDGITEKYKIKFIDENI